MSLTRSISISLLAQAAVALDGCSINRESCTSARYTTTTVACMLTWCSRHTVCWCRISACVQQMIASCRACCSRPLLWTRCGVRRLDGPVDLLGGAIHRRRRRCRPVRALLPPVWPDRELLLNSTCRTCGGQLMWPARLCTTNMHLYESDF